MTFLKLDAHYVHQNSDGLHIGAIGLTIALGDGTTVQIPTPFVPIGNDLGIAPAVVADGATALRIDFAQWTPVRYGRDIVAAFPYRFPRQETAVVVARAFDADPATHWRSDTAAMTAWLRSWGSANGVTVD